MKTLSFLISALLLATVAARELPARAGHFTSKRQTVPANWIPFRNWWEPAPTFQCLIQVGLYDTSYSEYYGTRTPVPCGSTGNNPITVTQPDPWQPVWPFQYSNQDTVNKDAGIAEQREHREQRAVEDGEKDRAKRIAGGIISTYGQWPWQVAFGEKNVGITCGGSLISDRWVLTAAHCFNFPTPDPWTGKYYARSSIKPCDWMARVGEYQLSTTTERASVMHTDIDFQKVWLHPYWNPGTFANDIALIKLASSAGVDDPYKDVNTICLPPKKENPYRSITSDCSASGFGRSGSSNVPPAVDFWGNRIDFGVAPDFLSHVNMWQVDDDTCKRQYNDPWKGYYGAGQLNFEQMMCFNSVTGSGVCNGDSGGPLVCRQSNNQYVQVGITSWGVDLYNCGAAVPQVFTKLTNYIDWIESVIGRNGLN